MQHIQIKHSIIIFHCNVVFKVDIYLNLISDQFLVGVPMI